MTEKCGCPEFESPAAHQNGRDTCHAWTAKEGVECNRETFRWFLGERRNSETRGLSYLVQTLCIVKV